MTTIPCPFEYANGRSCNGHINRIEAYKADIRWRLGEDGAWRFDFSPRGRFHFFCSEKSNHAGDVRPHDWQMKFGWNELPEEARQVIDGTWEYPVRQATPAGEPGEQPRR
jgi:hypothetical protein